MGADSLDGSRAAQARVPPFPVAFCPAALLIYFTLQALEFEFVFTVTGNISKTNYHLKKKTKLLTF